MSSSAQVVLAGGAQAGNVFWIVAGQTTIGTGATFNGTILDQTGIVLNTGAKLNGRALAQTAVTLDSNAVSAPAGSASVVVPTPIPVPPPVIVSPAPILVPTPTQNSTPIPLPAPVQYQAPITVPVYTGTMNNLSTPGFVSSSVSGSVIGQQVRAIAVSLGQGSRGSDVGTLQAFLISKNTGRAASALANVGATAYFGPLTRAALAEFQDTVGLPAFGNFGSMTRAYLSTQQ